MWTVVLFTCWWCVCWWGGRGLFLFFILFMFCLLFWILLFILCMCVFIIIIIIIIINNLFIVQLTDDVSNTCCVMFTTLCIQNSKLIRSGDHCRCILLNIRSSCSLVGRNLHELSFKLDAHLLALPVYIRICSFQKGHAQDGCYFFLQHFKALLEEQSANLHFCHAMGSCLHLLAVC